MSGGGGGKRKAVKRAPPAKEKPAPGRARAEKKPAKAKAKAPVLPPPASALPPREEQTFCFLLPVGPGRAYVGWHIAGRVRQRAEQKLGRQAGRYRLALRLEGLSESQEPNEEPRVIKDLALAENTGSLFLPLKASVRQVTPHVGLATGKRKFISLVRGPTVEMPRGGIASKMHLSLLSVRGHYDDVVPLEIDFQPGDIDESERAAVQLFLRKDRALLTRARDAGVKLTPPTGEDAGLALKQAWAYALPRADLE